MLNLFFHYQTYYKYDYQIIIAPLLFYVLHNFKYTFIKIKMQEHMDSIIFNHYDTNLPNTIS